MKFKPGDKVKCAFFGDEVFELREDLNIFYSVYFLHKDDEYSFTEDGKHAKEHTHPVLTLVERPEPRVDEIWVNFYKDGSIRYALTAKEAAQWGALCTAETAVRFVRAKE